ncbi:MAG TPA: hypothetical protein DCE56_05360 [Cyanobacteria bacterium UBA8553]|nr:hypothetical protein [Cyanobacteria bacterium UBA8553]HAJ59970.1 hypothetical protein [Cyanobacteria bacterium UBA8543]
MATESFEVMQTFGLDGSSYKMMVKDRDGNRYFVWYSYGIGINIGDEVLITIDDNRWKTISNPRNGSSSDITQVNLIT